MAAYFDFINDSTKEFKKAREIVKKYENNHVGAFKAKFKKIQDQLKELDDFEDMKKQPFGRKIPPKAAKGDDDVPMNPDQSEQITPEKKDQALSLKKKTEPIIHTIDIDENSG